MVVSLLCPLLFPMDYGAKSEIHTDQWLKSNDHSLEWLDKWLAEPQIDKQAITDWLTMYKCSEPSLIPRKFLR